MSSQKSVYSVELITQTLRERSQKNNVPPERVVAALARVGEIWAGRVAQDSNWTPPDGSSYPWAQVKISLGGLIPGLKGADEWLERSLLPFTPSEGRGGIDAPITLPASIPPLPSEGEGRLEGNRGWGLAALILAGNTPLMSWSPICACLLAGWSVFVKMSRDETLWPRLFVESLRETDPGVAARVHLDVWPGEEERTAELCRAADAVIAYGSDATIDALRRVTPETTPLYGFGHSVSVGIIPAGSRMDWRQFADDLLLYEQSGCLSLTALFVEASAQRSQETAKVLDFICRGKAQRLEVEPVRDAAVARKAREGRDLALFEGGKVFGDEGLRWTWIAFDSPRPMTLPGGNIVPIISVENISRDFASLIAPMQGRISCVGIGGQVSESLRAAILAEGVSRICSAGYMQAPPLDWPNGNRDLPARTAGNPTSSRYTIDRFPKSLGVSFPAPPAPH